MRGLLNPTPTNLVSESYLMSFPEDYLSMRKTTAVKEKRAGGVWYGMRLF